MANMSDSDDAVLAVTPAVRRPRPPHRRATAARGRRASSSESPVRQREELFDSLSVLT